METTNRTSAKIKFAGLYLLSIALLLFILFPFLEGNSAAVASQQPVQKIPAKNTVEDEQPDSTEIKKLADDYQKSLAQYQADIQQKDDRILELESRIPGLQNSTVTNKPVTTQNASSAETEKLKARLAALEKKNATLIELNNDLKKNNEYLTAQINSKNK